MRNDGRPANATPMARRVDAPSARPRAALRLPRLGWLAVCVGLVVVSAVGALHPLSAAGAGSPAAATPADAGSIAGLGGFDLLDLGVKCGIVLGLLFVCLRVLGRIGAPPARAGAMMKVLETRQIAAKASLHLVAVGERRLVVGLTPAGMVALAELDADELTDPATALDPASGIPAPSRANTFATAPIAALGPLAAPFDAFTGRLAGLVSGGRAR
jgi:flagellar biogenesis protein FliO